MLNTKNILLKRGFLWSLFLFFLHLSIAAQEEQAIDNKGNLISVKNNVVTLAVTAPTNPVEGDVWFDTTDPNNRITNIWDGSAWQEVTHEGTTGSLFFAGADGKPTENNNQLFWDTANNRLGIGNNSPDSKLQVSGTTRSQGISNSDGTAGLPSYRFTDDTDTGLYTPNDNEIGLTVGGIEAMKVEETLGATSVVIAETLELNGQVLDENNETGTAGQILSATATGTDWVDAQPSLYALNGTLASNRTVDGAGNALNFTNIDGGYNIIGGTTGVGETAPNSSDGALLHIQQETAWSGLGPWALYVEGYSYINGFRINGTEGERSIYTRESQLGFATSGNVPITFTQNDSQTRLSIKADGELRFHQYGGGTITGTETRLLGVEADGDVVEVDLPAPANLSTDAENSLSLGGDSGIFYESPIKAFGKISSAGGVVRASTGVSASRISTGRYRVTLTGVVSDGNYIIQLTQPGRGGAGNDDPGISYSNQSATGFDVIIGDNDNGGGDRARFNSEFMFTVLDL